MPQPASPIQREQPEIDTGPSSLEVEAVDNIPAEEPDEDSKDEQDLKDDADVTLRLGTADQHPQTGLPATHGELYIEGEHQTSLEIYSEAQHESSIGCEFVTMQALSRGIPEDASGIRIETAREEVAAFFDGHQPTQNREDHIQYENAQEALDGNGPIGVDVVDEESVTELVEMAQM